MTLRPGVEPFTLHVDDDVLDDLRDRLARTRWPRDEVDRQWSTGTEQRYLRELCAYWRDEFDWRAQEGRLAGLRQFTADIDGVRLHFVHESARDGRGLPLVLLHGWPSTFAEFLEVVPLLTDPAAHGLGGPRFDVVVPSLPGYCFSQRPVDRPSSYREVATLLVGLMQRLGYERFAVAGTDFGSGIGTYLALDHPERVVGLYLSHLEIHPWLDDASDPLDDTERAYLEHNARYWADNGGYVEIQSTRPRTLGYALEDSPAGLAAWIVEKWRDWADTGGDVESRFTKDVLLQNITLYWITRTIATSILDYHDNRAWFRREAGLTRAHRITTPTAFSTWPAYRTNEGIPPRRYVERAYRVEQWTDMPSGGHFAPLEEPRLFAEDLSRFVAGLRASSPPTRTTKP